MRAILLSLLLIAESIYAKPPTFWQGIASSKKEGFAALQQAQTFYRMEDFNAAKYYAQIARDLAPSIEADLIYSFSTFHGIFQDRARGLDVDVHLSCSEVTFLLESIREREPELGSSADIYEALGICYSIVGELERAVEENTFLAYYPGGNFILRLTGLNNLGDALMAKQDPTSAILAYQKSAKLSPGEPYTWFALAAAYYRNGEIRSAAESIQRAIAIDPYGESLDSSGIIFVPEEDKLFYLALAAAGRGETGAAQSFLGEYLSLCAEGPYRVAAKAAFLNVDRLAAQMTQKPSNKPRQTNDAPTSNPQERPPSLPNTAPSRSP